MINTDQIPSAGKSIRSRLLSITILLIFSSVLLVSSLSYSQYTHDFHEQSVQNILQITKQVSYNLGTYLDEIFRLSEAPYYNEELMGLLAAKAPETDLEKLMKRRKIEDYLNEMMITPRKGIISAYLISDEIYHGGRYSVSTDDKIILSQYPWYEQALSSNRAVFVPAHMEQLIRNPKFKVFSFVKRLNKISNPSISTGLIKIDANYTGIESIMKSVDLGPGGNIYIIDRNQTVVYGSTKDPDPLPFYELGESSGNISRTSTMEIKNYLLTFAPVSPADWTVMTVNSIREINRKAILTRNFTFFIAFLCAAAASIILLVFINSFLNPLLQIISLMKEVRRGNMTVSFPEKRSDEIGELGMTFNQMLQKINTMVKEVYEAKLLQNEAQMSAFFSQIRPHFLFNTLNMISLMIQTQKADAAVSMISRLSNLMRKISHLDSEILLEEEISLLDDYLCIQANRYRNRLFYEIDIPEVLHSYIIPALTFQPIVENTVIHGCEKKRGITHIYISASLKESFLLFTVKDDANGMTHERLLEIRRRLESSGPFPVSTPDIGNKNGIGLINVNKRIKIRYGDPYGITIDSIPGAGTSVYIRLPNPKKGA